MVDNNKKLEVFKEYWKHFGENNNTEWELDKYGDILDEYGNSYRVYTVDEVDDMINASVASISGEIEWEINNKLSEWVRNYVKIDEEKIYGDIENTDLAETLVVNEVLDDDFPYQDENGIQSYTICQI